ncbi:MAG: M20/M25/M40 family metallo-hydrolase [Deltaproteobacteria bacterium]|nr:M20/M25/M40 family metallo-hydrolase [Deltaproteobacteria bacterium]
MMHEAVDLLTRYLKIDTTNPPGNEGRGVAFFAEIFDREGIACKTYEASSGRGSIGAVIPGTGEKGAVILLNHIDVVPARADEWSIHPFSGEIKDGYIYGRGALDMKGQGILELLTFLEFKRKGLTPCRDLIFLAVADEEAGGVNGVQYLLNNHGEDIQADLVINEGGFGISDVLPDRPLFMIATAEKGVCRVKLRRSGPPGHGSVPHGDNALEKLVQGLNRLLAKDSPVIITPLIAEYFKQLGTSWEFLQPYLQDGKPETLVEILTQKGMLNIPQMAAMLKNTISLNMMHAGNKVNVIPSAAEAELDIRLLPGTDPDSVVAEIKEHLADDDIKIEVAGTFRASESSMDTEDFSIIKDVHLAHFPDALAVPSLLFGASDSRFFRKKGIPCYGVNPVLLSLEELGKIHGIDERISEENMIKGTEVFIDIVKKLCRV